ncbi:MAG: hypothetical protein II811_07455, partial [Spirochaetaceae bacterium]|nr:hypothetical protein [Spirochaetaceae bacterium]
TVCPFLMTITYSFGLNFLNPIFFSPSFFFLLRRSGCFHEPNELYLLGIQCTVCALEHHFVDIRAILFG